MRFEAKKYLICRFGGFVGEGLKKNPIFDITNELPLWLDPQSKLQFIDKDEAVNVVFKLLNLGLHNEFINICGNGLVCLQDVIKLAQTKSEIKPNSPKVLYNININKLLSYIHVKTSKEVVEDFVNKNLKKG